MFTKFSENSQTFLKFIRFKKKFLKFKNIIILKALFHPSVKCLILKGNDEN